MKITEILEKETDLTRPAVYVVATPIGNADDITIRALKILGSVDLLICEERKIGARLMRSYGIKHEFIELNEHNEKEYSEELAMRIVSENLTVALISDAGTPLFADPGNKFIPICYQKGISVIPIPGASSLMAALMAAGISSPHFLYYGFLPANKQSRQQAIRRLPSSDDIIILEAPYRLKQLINDMEKYLGPKRQAVLCWKLTYPEELIIEGNLGYIKEATAEFGKGEFVLILRRKDRR